MTRFLSNRGIRLTTLSVLSVLAGSICLWAFLAAITSPVVRSAMSQVVAWMGGSLVAPGPRWTTTPVEARSGPPTVEAVRAADWARTGAAVAETGTSINAAAEEAARAATSASAPVVRRRDVGTRRG